MKSKVMGSKHFVVWVRSNPVPVVLFTGTTIGMTD
jgi:hypothetical protein